MLAQTTEDINVPGRNTRSFESCVVLVDMEVHIAVGAQIRLRSVKPVIPHF